MFHGIHAVDTLRDIFGEVVEVYSRVSVGDDAGSLTSLCGFENGATGLLDLHSSGPASEQSFEAIGSRGGVVRVDEFAELRYSDRNHWAPGLPGRQGTFLRRTFDASVGDRKGYRTEFESFAGVSWRGRCRGHPWRRDSPRPAWPRRSTRARGAGSRCAWRTRRRSTGRRCTVQWGACDSGWTRTACAGRAGTPSRFSTTRRVWVSTTCNFRSGERWRRWSRRISRH